MNGMHERLAELRRVYHINGAPTERDLERILAGEGVRIIYQESKKAFVWLGRMVVISIPVDHPRPYLALLEEWAHWEAWMQFGDRTLPADTSRRPVRLLARGDDVQERLAREWVREWLLHPEGSHDKRYSELLEIPGVDVAMIEEWTRFHAQVNAR